MGRGASRIGTSGFIYPHWKKVFYPEELKERERLAYYAEHFDTVELNNTFYRLPTRAAVERWRDSTPRHFSFAVKGSRFITHMKKLKDPERSLQPFFEAIEPLGSKLGPVLFQLPPAWKADPERLSAFVDALPRGHRYAFELRDPSWFADEVLRVLERSGSAFCMYDIAGRQSPPVVTADWIYVRLHGPAARAYQGSYDDEALAGWAARLRDWNRSGKDAYLYFDNDQEAYAARDALRLLSMLKALGSTGGEGDSAPR